MTKEHDWYQILGVSPDASLEEIRSAYRSLARRYHPDTGEGGGDAARFQLVQQAWEVLSDPARRAEYERRRRKARSWRVVGISPIEPGRWMGGGSGPQIRYNLVVSPQEALLGGTVQVPIPYRRACAHCGGSGLTLWGWCDVCLGYGYQQDTTVMTAHVPAGISHNDLLEYRLEQPISARLLLRVFVRSW
jgi:DnaJ-class molecular chaperone